MHPFQTVPVEQTIDDEYQRFPHQLHFIQNILKPRLAQRFEQISQSLFRQGGRQQIELWHDQYFRLSQDLLGQQEMTADLTQVGKLRIDQNKSQVNIHKLQEQNSFPYMLLS